MYKLTTKHGDHFYLEHTGQVIATSDRPGYIYSGEWVILGVTTRHNAHRIISLSELLEGTDPGHGWIHDVDHGTHRVWGHPSDRRFASLVYIDPVLYECGSCGEHHAWTWNGDCREDKERFPGPEEYAAKVGIPVELVEVVEMQDRVDADLAGVLTDYHTWLRDKESQDIAD